MRTSTTVSLALALGASSTALATSPVPEGGSINALLHRQANRTHRGILVDTLPSFLKPDNIDGDVTDKNTTVIVLPHIPAKANESSTSESSSSSVAEPEKSDTPKKLVKRSKNKKNEAKRWVWATSIIQDSSPTEGLPPIGQNANLISGSAFTVPVNTPTNTLVAPTFPATTVQQQAAIVIPSSLPAELQVPASVAAASSSSSVVPTSSAVTRKSRVGAKGHAKRQKDFSHDRHKRWLWNNDESARTDDEMRDELLSGVSSGKARSTGSSAAATTTSAAARKPSAATYFYEEDALDEDEDEVFAWYGELEEDVEEESTSSTTARSTQARQREASITAEADVTLPYRLAAFHASRASAPSTSTQSEEVEAEEPTSTSISHRRYRLATARTADEEEEESSTSVRRPQPTMLVQQARNGKVQMTTILASRMERAAARGQPTDTIGGADEEDQENEVEKREVVAEEEDCEEE